MTIDSEVQYATIIRRTLSSQLPSDDIKSVGKVDINQNKRDDSDFYTLDPSVAEKLKDVTEKLSHDEILRKLKQIGAETPIVPSEIGTDLKFKRKIVWPNAIGFLFLHIAALYGVGLSLFGYAKALTTLYSKHYALRLLRFST